MKLVDAWNEGFNEAKKPYVHSLDQIIIEDEYYKHNSYDSFIEDKEFGNIDHKFHLHLLPGPYSGNIEKAIVYILMLNPGFAPIDYYAQQHCKEFRSRVLGDINQNLDEKYPFMNLDPQFAWTGGGQYWINKLNYVIQTVSAKSNLSYTESLSIVSKRVCTLEIVPYHSKNFRLPRKVFDEMGTSKLMFDFVHDFVLKKAKSDMACIIVTRGNNYWKLKDGSNVVVYDGPEARGAFLTDKTRGGKMMLKYLLN